MSRYDLTDFEWRVTDRFCPTSREASRARMIVAC